MVAFFSIADLNEDGTTNSNGGAVLAVGYTFGRRPTVTAKRWCVDNGYAFSSRISTKAAANLGVEDPSSITLANAEAQVVASGITMWA